MKVSFPAHPINLRDLINILLTFKINFKVRVSMKNFEGSIALVLPKSSYVYYSIDFVGSRCKLSQVFFT